MPKGQNAGAEGGRSLRDYARLRADVSRTLERLADINETVGQPARAARIREAREALLQQRFMLLVLGEFKRGKSTLVNRLLGVDTLPVGAAPTTAVLTRVTYGDEPSATIVMDDGSERAIDPDRLGEEITLIQTGEGANEARHAHVARAEVRLPAAICRDGVDLVDSPGLGEHRVRTEVTYEALPAADAVIFVSDAAQLGNEDEEFVRTRLANEDIDNVFFVINKWDRVYNESEDPEAEIAALRKRAWSLFVPEPKVGYNGQDLRASRIYPLSCRPGLAPEEERAELAGLFEAFRTDLEAFLVRESGRVALERAVARARALVAETQSGIRARLPALDADLAEFERRVAAAEVELRSLERPRQSIRNAIAARRQQMRQEVRRRATEGLPAVEEAIRGEFDAWEYRPPQSLSQRVLNSAQDTLKRPQIREEMREKARAIATARIEPWANELNSYVTGQAEAQFAEIEREVGSIDATFQRANRIIAGLESPGDGNAQDEMMNRGLAAGLGWILAGPFGGMAGGMHGWKGMGRAVAYQVAGILVVSIVGLPVLPVIIVASMIANVQSSEEFIRDLKRQALAEMLTQVEAMRGTGLADLEAKALAPLDALGTMVEKAIEARIVDYREQVESLRSQIGGARELHAGRRGALIAAQEEVAALSAGLEEVA